MTKINIKNLIRNRDLKIGLFSSNKASNLSFNIPGLRKLIVVDKKKYEKKNN